MAVIQLDRARLVHLLRQAPLQAVASSAVRKLGYAPQARMAIVQFTGGTVVYGYPNLSDEEIRGLLRVMEDHASIGEYVAKTIKARHDHEHVSYDPGR
jgi:hypothetical protein